MVSNSFVQPKMYSLCVNVFVRACVCVVVWWETVEIVAAAHTIATNEYGWQ